MNSNIFIPGMFLYIEQIYGLSLNWKIILITNV